MDEKKTIIITGASDGIGAEAARQLAAQGHRVIIVGRTPAKVQKIATELNAPYHIADYAKLSDIVRLAKELSAYPKIDVLANNAGAMMNGRGLTPDGFERTFQVNVLGQYLLTRLLLDKLCADGATVIQTASIASKLYGRNIDADDFQNEKSYKATKAYGESKLSNILFTRELERRYGGQGLKPVAFEPGVVRTNFASEGPKFFRFMYHTPFKYLFTISEKKSAKRLVRLALGEAGKDFVCGKTYSYKKEYKEKFKDGGSTQKALWAYCEEVLAPYLKDENRR